MSTIAAVLKQEITRLARREARSLAKPLYKAYARFRKDIAKLKRENAKARAEIVRLQRQASKGGTDPNNEAPAEKVRFTVASVKSQRRRLGLSAADFGSLIGVTAHTVYKWEHGTSKPRRAQVVAFAALRGIGKRDADTQMERLRKAATKKKSTRAKSA